MGQAKSPNWFQQQKGMITTSIFIRAFTKAESIQNNDENTCSNLVTLISYIQTKAMKHSISLEPHAKTQNNILVKKHHKKFKSNNTELQVSFASCFLAASADLETVCECMLR